MLIAAVGLLAWYELFREVPVHYADDADHYKYGSIGNEAAGGIPYWVWLALPRVFPQHLPGDGGYASLGMIFEQGKVEGDHSIGGEVPIGFSKKTIGFPRVAMSSALPHHRGARARRGLASHLSCRPVAAAQPAGLPPVLVAVRTTSGSRRISCSRR